MIESGSDKHLQMPLNEAQRERLLSLHKRLMNLHKILLDDERKAYEKANGHVASPHQVLTLVMHDPWFDWLHRISEKIITIDEIIDESESSSEEAGRLMSDLRALFKASDSEFIKRYRTILQREPAAIHAHIEVQKLLLPDA